MMEYKECLKKYRVKIEACHKSYLSQHCSRRTGQTPDKDEKCRIMLSTQNNTSSSSPVHGYLNCVKKERQKAAPCLEKLKGRCLKSKVRGLKTVRATMDTVAVLLNRHPHLKVLHLFRDPRAVTVSRLGNPSYRASVSKDVVTESKFYCNTVRSDIQTRKQLSINYTNNFKEIIYENMVLNPLNYSQNIYDFLGLSMPKTVDVWLRSNTAKSSSISTAWKKKLNPNSRIQIERICGQLFRYANEAWAPVSNK